MIRIAFLLNFPLEYKGGINYLKNLLYAIDKVNTEEVKVFLFVPNNLDQEYIALFEPYSIIVRTGAIKRQSAVWYFGKIVERLLNFNPPLEYLFKKYKIDVVSHSNYINRKRISINWIPDFQYLHYPELWPAEKLPNTVNLHKKLAKSSSLIVLSSNNALDDYKTLFPALVDKVKVLHFVSQPSQIDVLRKSNAKALESTQSYHKGIPFFYLPNQFWAHKNHIVVFKAVKELRDKGYNFLLITSGVMEDYRNKNKHVNMLKVYVEENDLTEVIQFLGVIPYGDVLNLIKSSVAVINPSLFEGWSSTVEEAKTLGASIILSDIAIHREQNPANALFFKTEQQETLIQHMELLLSVPTPPPTNTYDLEKQLEQRTKKFGTTYLDIIRQLPKFKY